MSFWGSDFSPLLVSFFAKGKPAAWLRKQPNMKRAILLLIYKEIRRQKGGKQYA